MCSPHAPPPPARPPLLCAASQHGVHIVLGLFFWNRQRFSLQFSRHQFLSSGWGGVQYGGGGLVPTPSLY